MNPYSISWVADFNEILLDPRVKNLYRCSDKVRSLSSSFGDACKEPGSLVLSTRVEGEIDGTLFSLRVVLERREVWPWLRWFYPRGVYFIDVSPEAEGVSSRPAARGGSTRAG